MNEYVLTFVFVVLVLKLVATKIAVLHYFRKGK